MKKINNYYIIYNNYMDKKDIIFNIYNCWEENNKNAYILEYEYIEKLLKDPNIDIDVFTDLCWLIIEHNHLKESQYMLDVCISEMEVTEEKYDFLSEMLIDIMKSDNNFNELGKKIIDQHYTYLDYFDTYKVTAKWLEYLLNNTDCFINDIEEFISSFIEYCDSNEYNYNYNGILNYICQLDPDYEKLILDVYGCKHFINDDFSYIYLDENINNKVN